MTTPDSSPVQPAERVVARLRPHARFLFWPSVVLVAVCGAVGYFIGGFPEQWQNLSFYAGAGLAVLLLFLAPLISWLSKRYTITTRRVIVRRGFFVRRRQEIAHAIGYDVTVTKNPMQSMFRSGTIELSWRADQSLRLKDVPKANAVQGALQELLLSGQSLAAARRQQERSAFTGQGLGDQPGIARPGSDETGMWGGR